MTLRNLKTIVFLLLIAHSVESQKLTTFDVQGHRGARGLMPENSIPAFLMALDSGVTTVEMDLAITKDKQIIVSHEPWMSSDYCLDPGGNPIDKKNEKSFNIYEMTYDQVKQFDCGSMGNKKFPEQQKISVNKPLLSDAIVAIENHIKNYTQYEVDYNIELKSEPTGDNIFHPVPSEFSDMVYDLIDQYLPLDRVIIQSFDFRVLQYWHEKYPDIRLLALVDDLKSTQKHLEELGFDPDMYSLPYRLMNKSKVEFLHQRNIRVIPHEVDKISEMLAVKGMEVDGFITDYPDRAKQFKYTLNIVPKSK